MIYVAADGVFAGYLALSDTLRAESAATIAALEAAGVRPVLLTGDHESAAGAIAAGLGIREVRAGCRPEEKREAIDGWQRDGMRVCMIGDGINDAPALKRRMWASPWAAWAATSPWRLRTSRWWTMR